MPRGHRIIGFNEDAARAMQADNLSWTQIARALNTTPHTVRMRIDAAYRERVMARVHDTTRSPIQRTQPMHVAGDGAPKLSETEIAQLLGSIPQDTRDLTARLMGDPLPGRSAADRRKLGQPA